VIAANAAGAVLPAPAIVGVAVGDGLTGADEPRTTGGRRFTLPPQPLHATRMTDNTKTDHRERRIVVWASPP
jgi:hypothetical protein